MTRLAAAVALPATLSAASVNWVGGTGTWNTATPNWNGGVWVNANNDTAVLTGTAGTVTVDAGGIGLAGLVVSTAGYVVSGGPLKFGANAGSIDTSALGTTANGSKVMITSNLTGSAGLALASNSAPATSSSTGGLYLSGDNTGLAGGITVASGMVNFASQNAAGTDPLTLNGGGIIVVNAAGTSGQTLTLANAVTLGTSGGSVRTAYTNSALTLAGVISGTGGLSKWDGGTLTFTNANTYAGATTLNAGTLALGTGGSLASSGSLVFSGSGTFALGSNSQTLADLSFSANATGTVTGTGTLALSGANAFNPYGYSNAASSTLNMAGLTTFIFGSVSAGSAFTLGRATGSTTASTVTTKLALGSNSIYTGSTDSFSVGTSIGSTGSVTTTIYSFSNLQLGSTNGVYTNTFNIGNTNGSGKIFFQTETTLPTLTLRGADGAPTSRVTTMTVSSNGSNYSASAGLLDTAGTSGDSEGTAVAGNLDALIGSLVIGRTTAGQGVSTGSIFMGSGTLDATSILIGQVQGAATDSKRVANGTLSVSGGSVIAGTLTIGDRNSSASTANANATFTMANGATLAAASIVAGANGGATGTVTRTFNWNDGTIRNYDATTNLTIGAGLTMTLANTGTHTFAIDTGRTATVNAVLAQSGSGATLTKTGAGTLTLSGANTYTGVTAVTAGTVNVTGAIIAASADGVTVSTGATLAISGTLRLTSASASLSNAGSVLIQNGVLDLGGLFDSHSGQYTLITGAGSTGGAFSSITGYAGTRGVSFSSGVLTFGAVPEPQAYGVAGAGVMFLAAYAGRRTKRRAIPTGSGE